VSNCVVQWYSVTGLRSYFERFIFESKRRVLLLEFFHLRLVLLQLNFQFFFEFLAAFSEFTKLLLNFIIPEQKRRRQRETQKAWA